MDVKFGPQSREVPIPNVDSAACESFIPKQPSTGSQREAQSGFCSLTASSGQKDPYNNGEEDSGEANKSQQPGQPEILIETTGPLVYTNTEPAPCKPQCQRFPFEQANPVDCIGAAPTAAPVDDSPHYPNELMQGHSRSGSDTCSTDLQAGSWLTDCSGSSATSMSSVAVKANVKQREVITHTAYDDITYLDCLDSILIVDNRRDREVEPRVRFATPTRKSRQRVQRQIRAKAKQSLEKDLGSRSDVAESAGALLNLKLGSYRSKGLRLVHAPLSSRPLGCTRLVKRRQLELWRNYLQIVAPWLDVLGGRQHFYHTLPTIAKTSDHLHYAVLAVSARHQEMTTSGTPKEESTELSRDAEVLLEAAIKSADSSVVAAYLLLCVCDLMVYSPTDCRDSMADCASLLSLVGIDASSTGFEQSLFWACAGLSCWSSSAGKNSMPLSLSQYYASDTLSTMTSYIRSQTWGDGYARYALFLTTTVLSTVSADVSDLQRDQTSKELNQWKALHDLLEDFYNCRPEAMQPLMSYPSILDDENNLFPMVLFGTGAAVMANLLYHTASILLLQHKPTDIELPKNHKSIVWHARQILGTVAECQQGSVTPFAYQPLVIAGKAVVDSVEQEKILEMIRSLEQTSGWRSSWCVEELQATWRSI